MAPAAAPAPAAPRARIGEELPLFCEACGYALHGLPQQRCDRCQILHYHCPECGHHQPINTLRPAAQRILGRIRATVLALWVFIKLNFFGWLLFAWFAMGAEWSYSYQGFRSGPNANNWTFRLTRRPIDLEAATAFAIFAVAFGMVSRMLLLRWRRGLLVGAVLGALVFAAVVAGGYFRGGIEGRRVIHIDPLQSDFVMLAAATGMAVLLAALAVWPVWMSLVHLFLPARAAKSLLDWQRSVPAAAPALARQP